MNRYFISPNFRLSEFECRCCGAVQISLRLVEMLESLRAAAGGRPLIITSGYRCSRHNRAVGGSGTSLHMRGLAADVRADASAQKLLAQHALRLGFGEIICGGRKGYIHLANKKHI